MATVHYVSAVLLVDGYDLSGKVSQLDVNYGAETLDATTFGAGGTRIRKGGLLNGTVSGRGFWDSSADPDNALFAKIGSDTTVTAIFPNGITEGSTGAGSGYAMKGVVGTYNIGGTVGELMPFEFSVESQGVGQ